MYIITSHVGLERVYIIGDQNIKGIKLPVGNFKHKLGSEWVTGQRGSGACTDWYLNGGSPATFTGGFRDDQRNHRTEFYELFANCEIPLRTSERDNLIALLEQIGPGEKKRSSDGNVNDRCGL